MDGRRLTEEGQAQAVAQQSTMQVVLSGVGASPERAAGQPLRCIGDASSILLIHRAVAAVGPHSPS